MPDLRDLFGTLGSGAVRTLLQSGNVVFTDSGKTCDELECVLEAQTEKRLKVQADYFVRTADEWAKIIAENPFGREARADPGHLLVMFMKEAPRGAALKALQSAVRGPELIRAHGRQLYITYPAGIGRSKLTVSLIEGKLGSRGTGRNWNTVLKLMASAEASKK